jgi:hypothetical protein
MRFSYGSLAEKIGIVYQIRGPAPTVIVSDRFDSDAAPPKAGPYSSLTLAVEIDAMLGLGT